jgi:hypothetical protein
MKYQRHNNKLMEGMAMSTDKIRLNHPPAIIAVCFIGLINAMQLTFMIFTPVSKQFGSLYPVYFSVAAILSLISIAGLWWLKKWAVYLYLLVLILNQLVLLSMGLWELSAVIMPLIILILLWQNKDKLA